MDCNHASSNKAAPTKPSKNHVRKLLIILLLIGITIGLWLAFREPVFQGESAGYWLDRMDSDTKEEASVSAFKALGKPGVLFLVKRIKEKRVRPGESWIDRLAGSNLPLPKFIRTVLESRRSVPPIDRREQALHMLRLLGPDAEPALPELMREFKARVNAGQTMEYWDALPALEATGDTKVKYVPEFINALQNDWEPTVMDGAILLGSIGPKAKAAVPVLLEQMPAGDWALSNLLTEALWKIDRPTNLALEVFTNELLTVRRSDQPVPLRSLGEMGPAAKPAASLVLPLLTNSDERLRMAAAKALSEIDPALFKSTVDAINQNPTASIERLLQVITKNSLEPKSRFASMRALEALAVYGPDARSAVPVLIEIL